MSEDDNYGLKPASELAFGRISALFYGGSGIGKTTLAATLVNDGEFPCEEKEILVLSFDPGELALRGTNIMVKRVLSHNDLIDVAKNISGMVAKNNFKWVILDGLDEAGKLILDYELGRTKDGRAAYGEMARRSEKLIHLFRDDVPCSTIFITHDDFNEAKGVFGPRFSGKTVASILPDKFDLVGAMHLVDTEEGKMRMIQFDPSIDEQWQCKDRAGVLSAYEEPNMAGIFEKIFSVKNNKENE